MAVDLRLIDAEPAAPSFRKFPAGFSPGRPIGAPTPPAQLQIWIVTAQPPLREKNSHIGSSRAETPLVGIEQHVREPRLQWNRGDGAPVGCHAPLLIDGAEACEATPRFV